MIRILTLTAVLFCGVFSCSSEQSTIALNWFTRIDHAPGCGDKNVALITGTDTLLCPLYRAIFNGDSLVAKSEGKCYFIDLQDITKYNSIEDLEEIDCADFDQFIKLGAGGWPKQGIYDQRVE